MVKKEERSINSSPNYDSYFEGSLDLSFRQGQNCLCTLLYDGAAQNWAMPVLQALDEGRHHDLLISYDAFQEAVIGVFGDIDRRDNAKDRLGRLQQTGSVATYISMFNKYTTQVDWNEANLMAHFGKGLKDKFLNSVATTESHPCKLQEWMAMAFRIDERLWARHHSKHYSTTNSTSKTQSN